MAEQKRLFLLDAYALIFRGYYAFINNPIVNSKGMDTSAIMAFTNSLFDVIRREKPDHLAVCVLTKTAVLNAPRCTVNTNQTVLPPRNLLKRQFHIFRIF